MELIEPHIPFEEDKSPEIPETSPNPMIGASSSSCPPPQPSPPDTESLISNENPNVSSPPPGNSTRSQWEQCFSRFYVNLHKNICRYYIITMLVNFYMFLFRASSSEVFIIGFFVITFVFIFVRMNPPQNQFLDDQEAQVPGSLMAMMASQRGRARRNNQNWRLHSQDPEIGGVLQEGRRRHRHNQPRQVDFQRLIRARILQILSQRHAGLVNGEIREGQRAFGEDGSALPLFLQIIQMQDDERWINDMINMMRENSGRSGMTDREINEIPVVLFKDVEGAWEADSCSICLENYTEESECKMLSCHHLYHSSCISEWLKISKECPVCKSNHESEQEP